MPTSDIIIVVACNENSGSLQNWLPRPNLGPTFKILARTCDCFNYVYIKLTVDGICKLKYKCLLISYFAHLETTTSLEYFLILRTAIINGLWT